MLTHESIFHPCNSKWDFSLYIWKHLLSWEEKWFSRTFGLSQLTHDKATVIIQTSNFWSSGPHIMRHCNLEGHTPGHPCWTYNFSPHWRPLTTLDHSDRQIYKSENLNSQNSASWGRMTKRTFSSCKCYFQLWHLLKQLSFINNLSAGRSKRNTSVPVILSKILPEVAVAICIL